MHRVYEEGITTAEKRQRWQEIIKDFLKSDSAIKAYSAHHALNYDHLGHYLRQHKAKQKKPVPEFIPITITEPSPQTQECHYQITWQDFQLNLLNDFNPKQVASLLNPLRKPF